MFTEGKTPFVSPQDVEREKDRRAQIGLDPDYFDNPLEGSVSTDSKPLKFDNVFGAGKGVSMIV